MKIWANENKINGYVPTSTSHDNIHYRQTYIPQDYRSQHSKDELHLFTGFNTRDELYYRLKPTLPKVQNKREL